MDFNICQPVGLHCMIRGQGCGVTFFQVRERERERESTFIGPRRISSNICYSNGLVTKATRFSITKSETP